MKFEEGTMFPKSNKKPDMYLMGCPMFSGRNGNDINNIPKGTKNAHCTVDVHKRSTRVFVSTLEVPTIPMALACRFCENADTFLIRRNIQMVENKRPILGITNAKESNVIFIIRWMLSSRGLQ